MPIPRIAIVGAGVSGLTAAWQLLQDDPSLDVTLFESAARTGGIIDTIRQDGFLIEMGPDSWVTEKSAARELATELGLADELLFSNDDARKTLLLLGGRLVPLPDNMRMMVPVGRNALADTDASPLLTPEARHAYRRELDRAAELRRMVPTNDESIASFTERHFGREVLRKLAAPLLSGVFGGDVRRLSVHAVMAPFVAMEREFGSLIAGLGERDAERLATGRAVQPVFTTLRSGLGSLTDALTATLPTGCLRLGTRVQSIQHAGGAWSVRWVTRSPVGDSGSRLVLEHGRFDHIILATSAQGSARLLQPIHRVLARLLPQQASSAILVAFAWTAMQRTLPPGFGFLVPPSTEQPQRSPRLLAGTFVDQKFDGRVPDGGRLVRAFFGTSEAERLLRNRTGDAAIALLALRELERIVGPLPPPTISAVRQWPLSLPQYNVGHLERTARFERQLALYPGLHLLGNGLHGVGLPDLIRQARALARHLSNHGCRGPLPVA